MLGDCGDHLYFTAYARVVAVMLHHRAITHDVVDEDHGSRAR